MSSDLSILLESIQKKLVQLQEKQGKLEEKNSSLQNELTAIKLRNSELLKQMEEKEESFKTLRLARKMAGDNTDTQGVKRQINELVKEIDKCVALLNR
jgi:predicted nuclease with TOPRIM domain